MKRIIGLFCFLLSGASVSGQSNAISITGTSWSASAPTLTEAGNNYSSNVTSASNQTLVTVSSTAFLGLLLSWKVMVTKQDVSWNSNLTVWIRKTGDGTSLLGSITPSGTSSYIQLSTTQQELFRGTNVLTSLNRNNVPIQYEIRGLSVTIPAANYSANVIYTLIDL
ncbi:hypothetical protein SAMN04515674_102126 [Pseudarcicella hirudinis]|uniref:Uncharacterized protein n=1 Tax=Pseudarcicella hirudinis TaxID=1079859 RepID=A0A1I5NV23_9BACT|nr:hypothetical protein [Pseudarcicella hirudinis]SFP25480.1 hypothetical protein SAMN04515674_102126 [Pseudarcicella hirudinis]